MNETPSTEALQEAQKLIQQIFDEVVEEEGHLAGGRKLGTGGNAFKDLNETKISFGYPDDRLTQLTADLLQKMSIELDPIQAAQFQNQYDFYYMAVPVSLFPKRGNLFKRVECQLTFSTPDKQKVIVQTLFPDSKWRSVINWGGSLSLGLNGSLDWEVGVPADKLAEVKQLAGVPTGSIKTNNEMKARILVPDYSFQLGRQEIVATGQGQNFCRWRLQDPELKQINDLRFIVIFKVPKGTKAISLYGQIQAEPDMELLTAELDNVYSELSGWIKSLFQKPDSERKGAERLPIGDHEVWDPLPLPTL